MDEPTVTLELSVREARALWRFASMFAAALQEAVGNDEPCEIDAALAKTELALMLVGEPVS